MEDRYNQQIRIKELEELLEQAECKSDILTNLLKEANAEFNQALDNVSTSEANFRAIFESAPEAIYIFDVETHQILDCNPYTIRWLGYTHQELLSLKVENILEPMSFGVQENVQRAIDYGSVHVQERRFRKKTGILVEAEVTGTIVEIQGKKCFLALVRDITERKTIEELSRYKELFENVSDPVIISHSQGGFLEVNDVACDRFGYTRWQLLNMSFKDIVCPYQTEILEEMGQKIRSGEMAQFELETRTRTGETIPFEFHSRMINYQRKPAVLSVARDLSTRKKMEETLIRGERLAAVGELSSGVAHNFNNLLQIIIGAGEAANAKLGSGEIRKCKAAINSIIDACKRGVDIVKRIKDFTQFTTNAIIEARIFDLGELIEEAVELTRPLWKNPAVIRKYRLTHNRASGCLVKGNPSELYEVLVNIIKNGLEAMPQGGELTIHTEIGDGEVLTLISDTGIGISEEKIQRIFEPFYTTKGSKSSGLGLSSSYGIITKHQGDIVVKSTLGKGTTFAITLPLATSIDLQEDRSLFKEKAITKGKIKFLIIDDEISILKMMEMWFEDSEVEVHTANTVEKGLQTIINQWFDVILCDYGMNDMNGLELGKAYKEYCDTAGISKAPFMLYTGFETTLGPKVLETSGVDRVVKKPIHTDELLCIIHEVIASK
jgi:PAS domain S-box-containing protein